MANPPIKRKRVHAIRRASDGSAFEKCYGCGVLVAISLADMHECGVTKVGVKRFKGFHERPPPAPRPPNVVKQSSFADQPRSPFRFFMESFLKTCKGWEMIDIDRKGFEAWKNMSEAEKQPYLIGAEKLNAAHERALMLEVNNKPVVDNEADSANSAIVGKFDKFFIDLEDDESEDFEDEESESLVIRHDWFF